MATKAPGISPVAVGSLAPSFRRSLLAANKSDRTVETYMDAVRLFSEFLTRRGMPSDVANIHREHVEAFIADILERWKPATANNRYRALQQFFKWLVEEGEVKVTPMLNMKPPFVPEESPPVMTGDQLRQLLKTCEGRDFESRRDTAILRLFMDTGMRRAELGGLKLEDVDLDANIAVVLGKGRRSRACPFGRKTALALDRYLRIRTGHRDSEHPELWLGHAGPMTHNGIAQVIYRRAKQAGLERIHPHLFRHSFAHEWLV